VRRNAWASAGVAEATAAAHGAKSRAREWDPADKGGRRGRATREATVEMSLTADDNTERSRRIAIDRLDDTYEETILNPDGSIRHHQREPLSEHRGHGSAKKRVAPPEG
jgi:hypothetical protein